VAPIAIIDFGKVISERTNTFGRGGGARTTVARVQDENVMIPAAPPAVRAEEPMMTRNLWRRVKDKAFGKAHVRCGRD
jgi:hypothetical protein